MPFYTYICQECDSYFESFASIQKKESGWKPICPKCGSTKTCQIFAAVAVSTGSKRSYPTGGCCGSRKGAGR